MANALVPIPGTENNYYKPNFTMPGASPDPVSAPGTLRAGGPRGIGQRLGAAVRTLPGVETAVGVGGAALKGARAIAKPAAVAGVIDNFNDYKIDDPEVDSSVKGTYNALRSGDFDMAGRSLSKGALETLMDLGSGVAGALDYVVPGKAPVSTAYSQMLRDQFGGQLVDNTRKPDAGAGRGFVNPTAPTTPTAPTSTPAPPIRQPFSDVRNGTYGSTAPNPPSPPDLTGKIIKSTDANGNAVYTGANIKAGADIVDRDGKILNTNDPSNPISLRTTGVSGPVNSAIGGPSAVGGAPAGRSVMDIYANASRINKQISDTVREADAYGPGGGGGGMTGINGNGIFDSLRAAQRGAAGGNTIAERMHAAELANRMQTAVMQNNAATYSSDISRANNRDTVRATLRGQDMDYAEKMDAKRMDLAAKQHERALMASITEGTNDPRVMLQRALRAGVDPAKFISGAQELRASGEAERKHFDKVLEAHSGDGKGGISAEKLAQNRVAAQKMGAEGMSPAEIDSGLRILAAYNSDAARKDTLMRRLGFTQPRLRASELPRLDGYTPEVTGRTANWNPTIGVGQGNLRANHPTQDPAFFDFEPSTGDLKFMEQYMGLKLPPP